MKRDKNKWIIGWQTKCSLCGQKVQGCTEQEAERKLIFHIENECAVAATMRDWERDGIYKEAMQILRGEGLEKALRKLLKSYTLEEIEMAIEVLKER